jgi:FixJ family two-component response regulator
LDLQLPGLSGLDLQKQMAEAGLEIPVVFRLFTELSTAI